MCVVIYFVAPVCFNTTYCEGESFSDYLLSFEECCSELSGVSFASSGQCLLCKTGTQCKMYKINKYYSTTAYMAVRMYVV